MFGWTQQGSRAYTVMLASQFRGFCRDLHTESAGHLVDAAAPEAIRSILEGELTRDRKLDRGNAHPGSIGEDFGRLGLALDDLKAHDPRTITALPLLGDMNRWRNAIVHHDFDPAKLGGTVLSDRKVRLWRAACRRVARTLDAVIHDHLLMKTGARPW